MLLLLLLLPGSSVCRRRLHFIEYVVKSEGREQAFAVVFTTGGQRR